MSTAARARAWLWTVALTCAAARAHAQARTPEPERTPANTQTHDDDDAALGARAVVHGEGAGESALNAEQARSAPGALGEPARALADLPGVGRSAFDSGELVVWGSAAADQRVYLDGVELPALFHAGGFRTTVHPALLERVALVPGAAGPEYGRALGAAIELDSTPLRSDPGLELSADLVDASASATGSLGPVRALWALRAGYLDRLQRWLAPDTRDVVPVPSYADGTMRLGVELGSSTHVIATWLGSHDLYRIGHGGDGQTAAQSRTRSRDFQLVALRLQRAFADGATIRITPFAGIHTFRDNSVFDLVPARLELSELRYGLRASYSSRTGIATLHLGCDGLATRTGALRSGSLTLPAREGDVAVFGQPPGDDVAVDRWSTHDVNVAPYARLGLQLGPLLLRPGVRLETHALSTSRRTPRIGDTPAVGASALFVRPEPRLQARIELASWLALDARAGIHHQPPPAADRSAVFGNPELGLSRSYAAAMGPSVQLSDLAEIELIGFYKRMDHLIVRSAQDPPPLAGVLTADGEGRSYGLQAALRRRAASGVHGSLAYTLSRSERDDPDGNARIFDSDQTHVLSAVLGYAYRGFEASVRARVASGAPRTAIVGAYFDVRDARYEARYGPIGGARLPAFFALDLHVEHTFEPPDVRWTLYLDVLNVTDHDNVEEVAYSHDYGMREDVRGLPILAVIGAKVKL